RGAVGLDPPRGAGAARAAASQLGLQLADPLAEALDLHAQLSSLGQKPFDDAVQLGPTRLTCLHRTTITDLSRSRLPSPSPPFPPKTRPPKSEQLQPRRDTLHVTRRKLQWRRQARTRSGPTAS